MMAMPATAASSIPVPSSFSADGRALDGEDIFTPSDGREFPANATDEFAIRFHLHPAIKASRLADGRGVILLLHDRELWTFATLADAVELEESVFLAGYGWPAPHGANRDLWSCGRDGGGALELPSHAAGGAGLTTRPGP